jgi:hypothetical protein
VIGVGLLIFAILVIPTLQAWARPNHTGLIPSAEYLIGSQKRFGDKVDNTMVVVDRINASQEYLWGGSSLGFVTHYAYWLPHDRAPFIHETRYFVENYFPEKARLGIGLPVPLIATLYWNGHVVGIVLGMGIFGAVWRGFYTYCLTAGGLLIPVYGTFWFAMYGFYGGSLSQSIAYNLIPMVAVGITYLYVRPKMARRVGSTSAVAPEASVPTPPATQQKEKPSYE